MKSEKYTLELTDSELYWLASAWGFSRLPLINNEFQNFFQREIDARLDDARASLLNRGLIKPSSGFGWQLESVPAGLVRWIATANQVSVFKISYRTGATLFANFYHQDKHSLSLLKKNDVYEFSLYQQPDEHVKQMIAWMSAEKTSAHEKNVVLPTQVTGSLIRDMWRDHEITQNYIQNSGWDDSSNIPWIETTDRFVTLTFYKIQAEKILPIRDISFIGKEYQIWISSGNATPGFSPINREALETTIKTFCEVNS